MKDQEHECLLCVTGIAVTVTTKKDWSKIKFESGPAMKEILSRTRGAYDEDGKVVPEGEIRRRWLHTKLDEWIDKNLKDEK